MKTRLNPSFLTASLIATSLSSTAAQAQDGAQANPRSLEEVIVTAQRREQSLLEVPMAVAAFSQSDLRQRGITALSDLQFAVPGMTMREDGPGSNTIFLRGVVNQYGAGPVVGQFLDEIPVSLTAADQLDVRATDLARVEVLKGPQGTLFGQGSMAGVVRYLTNKPNLEATQGGVTAATAYVSGGDPENIVTGFFDVPLVEDTLGLRIAGRVQEGGGWQDQPEAGIKNGNGQDLLNVRALLLWRATDRVDVELMYNVHHNEVELGLGYEDPDRTVFVAGDPSTRLIPKDLEYEITALTVTADLGFANLVSATAYIDVDHEYPFAYQCGSDTNCGPFEGNDDRFDTNEQFTQELRLVSAGDGPLSWTVGAFYRDLDDQLIADYRTFEGVPDSAPVLVFEDRFFQESSSESIAVYSDIAYDITERLTLGLGARYFEEDRESAQSCCLNLQVPVVEQSGSFDSFDPRVYARYALTESISLYGSISEGFRSGGFNDAGDPPYDPEDLLTYELGIKGSLNQSRLSFELAGFYNDFSDMLRRGLVFNGTNFTSQLSNIGDVDVFGLEGGFAYTATDSLSLSATASWLDSEVQEIRADDATNLPGDELDYVPQLTYSLSGVYDFQWGSSRTGFVRIDYNYRDEVSYIDRSSFDVVPQFSDSFGLLNARIALAFTEAFSVELFGTNLTNENEWQDPYHNWRNANRTRPRSVGLRLLYEP
ncbi:MAG: TonB-dependent receptor [Pseudomonadota bacterium]